MDKKRKSTELAALDRELRKKVKRRDDLNQQITQLQRRIMELSRPSRLVGLDGAKRELAGVGLTDAIRILMRITRNNPIVQFAKLL